MKTQRETYRTPTHSGMAMGAQPERRSSLSTFISRMLVSVAEREQQRSRLINVLIIAQALLTVAVAPGYLTAPGMIVPFVIILCSLVIYLLALAFNQLFHRATLSACVLVVGGSLATIAAMVALALVGRPADTGEAALLLPALILEAGLLFAPEVTLIVAFASTAVTASALLLALSLTPRIDTYQAYLLMAYTLGLQLLSGLIAWLLSQFIFESTMEAQRAQELQFAQARLESLATQVNDRERYLDEGIRSLQITLTRAIVGEYNVRAEVVDEALAPLADSLNLLLERVEASTQTEQAQSRIQAAVLPLIDSISRIADSGTPTPTSLPIMTNTPFDMLAVVINQMQVSVSQRMARVQRLAVDVVGALGHSQDGLNGASEAVQESQRIAGALISSTEILLDAVQKQVGQISQMRRMLSALLPKEITQMAQDEGRRESAGATGDESFMGLGLDLGLINGGLTSEYPIVAPESEDGSAQIPPLTMPLPIIELSPLAASAEEGSAPEAVAEPLSVDRDAGELAPELVESWNLLTQLNSESAQLQRSMTQFARELGVQSRQMRTADGNIVWLRQALEAVRGNAEQLQQVAGAVIPPPGPGDGPAPSSRPLNPRGPQPTRPLAGELMRGEDLASLADIIADRTGRQQPRQASAPPAISDDAPATGSMRAADLLFGSGFGEDEPQA